MPVKKYIILATDGVVVRGGKVLLVKRRFPPFEGSWVMPGGHVEYGETTERACVREVREETGIDVKIKRLVGVYSNPDRDPRGHVVAVAYLCDYVSGELGKSRETLGAGFFSKEEAKRMVIGFDHKKMLKDIKFL